MFELIIGLSIIGVVLVFVELFIPGLVVGICGALCLLAAVALTYLNFGLYRGNMFLGVLLVAAIGLFLWWMRAFPDTRFGRRFTLREEVPNSSEAAVSPQLDGRTGLAHTDLRPAGTMILDGQRFDVIAESEMIDRGTAVRVVRVEGPKIVVRRAT